ncbi:MAG: coproporphyrinogen dehydrogenase HemZ, partial [Clostridia bacterium]|nr:coproporphyrinogen dehydrogenase HemZ [Clostridia bacterium]
MQIININNSYHYETENLLRVFFPDEKFHITEKAEDGEDYCVFSLDGDRIKIELSLAGEKLLSEESFSAAEKQGNETEEAFYERKGAIMLFDLLCAYTSYTPPWGILTGVRPAKLMTKLVSLMGEEGAKKYFTDELKVSEEKTALALMVAKNEAPLMEINTAKSFSLYISVPFCPSRCSYCSFISHSNDSAKKLIPSYVEKLCQEIKVTGDIAKELGLTLESVYMGGGTPTALPAEELKKVTDAISENFDVSSLREYTIEAGRPDSITDEKLEVIKNCGATRISINPQTFSDEVLKIIGRNHTSQMTVDSFLKAREKGFDNINMDLIAGLPGDTAENYEKTLETALSFSPENITVHTLALKRSSTIVTEKRNTNSGEAASQMLSYTQERLLEEGYIPYYMYRQSKCLGNLENVGWAKKGYEGLYNVYMMEEIHSVFAVGAGAVIKLKSPFDGAIERIFNYKYPYEYIGSFDEIIKRKEQIKT